MRVEEGTAEPHTPSPPRSHGNKARLWIKSSSQLGLCLPAHVGCGRGLVVAGRERAVNRE